jgi:low temperature requirement protein LtrA
LFVDLIFVAAVAQVAEPLRDHYSVIGLMRFTPLFVLIWWAWTGQTVFSTRFDTDDVIQRGLTLMQMCAVAAMADNAKDALDSRSSAGFAAAYAPSGSSSSRNTFAPVVCLTRGRLRRVISSATGARHSSG